MVSFHLRQRLYLCSLCIMNVLHIYNCAPTQSQQGLSLCIRSITAHGNNVLECGVDKGQQLDYKNIRNWSETVKDTKYSVKIVCNGGSVFLPWPFKAKNIVSLEVTGCKIEGFLSEMTVFRQIQDELASLVLDSISIEIPFSEMLELSRNHAKVPSETDCGQLSLETLVLKDIHYNLHIGPEERDGVGIFSLKTDKHKHHKVNKKCVYSKLRYIDESGSWTSGHLRLLPEYSVFPKLEVYNMSRNNLRHIPRGFRSLHSKKFPVLQHIDFSKNALTKFEFKFPVDLEKCHIKVIDLKNNQIDSISSKTIKRLQNIDTLLIDLRHNPLLCTCQLSAYRKYLQTQYKKTTDIKQRKLVSDITCNYGPFLPGKLKELSLLDASFDQNCVK